MILYILRHGETDWNKQKRLQGQSDIPLNQNGVDLARKTGEGMKNVPIDLIISSPLMRAKNTAELVTEGRDIPLITDKRIIEISFGTWEGENTRETKMIPQEFLKLFHEDPISCERPPEGENFVDVRVRTKDFYESLLANPDYKDKSILISTHGAAGRCLLTNFYEDKDNIWRGNIPPNCSICVVEVKDGIGKVIEKDKVFSIE